MARWGKNNSDDMDRGIGARNGLAQAKTRLLFVLACFFIGYLAISLRLVDLTLLRGNEANQQETKSKNGKAVKKQASLRGTILDRNGELMATSLKVASVYADATLVHDAKSVAAELAPLLPDTDAASIEKKLASGRKFVWLARNITPKQEYAINSLGHPALGFEHEYKRIYPHGQLTSHLLGYTDVDDQGIAGAEKAFDRELSEPSVSEAEDLRLSVDLRIQHVMHRELKKAMEKFSAKAAIGMAMDVNTGEVIAAVSLPDFDPHHPGDASPDALFSRTTLGVFEMGSTFKLFSVAGALDAGKVDYNSQIDAINPIRIGRFAINDYHAKKRVMSLPEVFIHSSNIGTAKVASLLGNTGLKDFYEKLGFAKTAPVELPERGLPLFPEPWREITTLTASYGHGIAVSPLHLMRATAAMVNGGILVKPTIRYDAARRANLKPQGSRVISEDTSHKLRQLMELVVAQGTGSKAYVEGYHVGGKTGTADKSGVGGYNKNARFSSFIGVFPIRNPRYAVVAILDEPQPTKDTYGYATGGWTAAPVVARVIEQMGPLYQIPPDLETGDDIVATFAPYLRDEQAAKKGNGNATR